MNRFVKCLCAVLMKARTPCPTWKQTRRCQLQVESLEERQLLSSTALLPLPAVEGLTASVARLAPQATYLPGGTLTPAQVKHAYGFDFHFIVSGKTVSADGRGQTIAIVDAYDEPNIRNDLAVFDRQYGLSAPPNF